MRIHSLLIKNFRGLELVELDELKDVVVIAGPNGSGKSCLLDAMRLLKSTYGGYQQNEFQQWLGEFQLNQNDPNFILKVLRDEKTELVIKCEIELHPDERSYLAERAEKIIEDHNWKMVAPELGNGGGRLVAPLAAQFRLKAEEVIRRTKEQTEAFKEALHQPLQIGKISKLPDQNVEILPNQVLELLFSTYDPKKIGVIDFHGPQRFYNRENTQSVNIRLRQNKDQARNHSLYNISNKYNNIKTELATAYVNAILLEKAGHDDKSASNLGRRLIKSQPNPNCGQLYHCEVG